MPRFTSKIDGAQLFYRDYEPATEPKAHRLVAEYEGTKKSALVFLHGNPLSSFMFECLMVPLCESYRFRCVAPDRRGFGRSDWSGPRRNVAGTTFKTFAQDVADLVESLELGPFVFVTSSMGGGESIVAHSISSYVKENCKGFIWTSPILPSPVATPENPAAPPPEGMAPFLDSLRASSADLVRTLLPLYIVPGNPDKLSTAFMARIERDIDGADALAMERCNGVMVSKDFTADLKALGETTDLPFLCVHGELDPAMPFEAVEKLQKIIPRLKLNKYEGGGHVLQFTDRQRLLEDILGFLKDVEI